MVGRRNGGTSNPDPRVDDQDRASGMPHNPVSNTSQNPASNSRVTVGSHSHEAVGDVTSNVYNGSGWVPVKNYLFYRRYPLLVQFPRDFQQIVSGLSFFVMK